MDDLKRKYNVTFEEPPKAEGPEVAEAKNLLLNQAKDIEAKQ